LYVNNIKEFDESDDFLKYVNFVQAQNAVYQQVNWCYQL